MKIFETVNTEKEEDVLQDIVCNLCGKKIPKNEFGYYEDYINIEKLWGFHSEYDGETHNVDICQSCYKGLIDTMSIKELSDKKKNKK